MKATYNQKAFLLPDSHRSMSSIHSKVMDDGIMKISIHDCHKSIQLHNDLKDKEQVVEALDKIDALLGELVGLKDFILENYLLVPPPWSEQLKKGNKI